MFLETIFPFSCPFCETYCSEKEFCPCGKLTQKPPLDWKWLDLKGGDPIPIFSLFLLNESAKHFLHRVKYGNQPYWLKRWIEPYLVFPFSETEKITLIPVPSAKSTWLKRGFNPAEEIAQVLAKQLGFHLETKSLMRKKWKSRPQAGLGRKERLKNNRESFYFEKKQDLTTPIILVDDVVTTGSTIKECVRVLRKSKKNIIGAWTMFQA